jgi:hypothetical protein
MSAQNMHTYALYQIYFKTELKKTGHVKNNLSNLLIAAQIGCQTWRPHKNMAQNEC